MEQVDPLPLIRRLVHETGTAKAYESTQSLAFYGRVILVGCWTLFVITANTIFLVWKYVIAPLAKEPSTQRLHAKITVWCERIDSYVLGCWCVYVVLWWWFLVSWVALKLFRHSKGIQKIGLCAVPTGD